MNDSSNIPPMIPPGDLPNRPVGESIPRNADAAVNVPIQGLTGVFEAILRQPTRVIAQLRGERAGGLIGALVVLAILCSLLYGLVVGTFSGGEQLWAAPVKIAGGLLISALICLPSLYIFACLSGAETRLLEVSGLVAGTLALFGVLLIGIAPVAWVFSQSTESATMMGALHLLFGVVAVYFGLGFLHKGLAALSDSSSRSSLRVWTIMFLLVVLQMTTALRPIVGKSTSFLPTEKKFFLSHWGDCLSEKPAAKAETR